MTESSGVCEHITEGQCDKTIDDLAVLMSIASLKRFAVCALALETQHEQTITGVMANDNMSDEEGGSGSGSWRRWRMMQMKRSKRMRMTTIQVVCPPFHGHEIDHMNFNGNFWMHQCSLQSQ